MVSWLVARQAFDNEARRFKLLSDFSVALCRIAFSLFSKASGLIFKSYTTGMNPLLKKQRSVRGALRKNFAKWLLTM